MHTGWFPCLRPDVSSRTVLSRTCAAGMGTPRRRPLHGYVESRPRSGTSTSIHAQTRHCKRLTSVGGRYLSRISRTGLDIVSPSYWGVSRWMWVLWQRQYTRLLFQMLQDGHDLNHRPCSDTNRRKRLAGNTCSGDASIPLDVQRRGLRRHASLQRSLLWGYRYSIRWTPAGGAARMHSRAALSRFAGTMPR